MSVIGPRPGLWNQDVLTAERDKYNANDVKSECVIKSNVNVVTLFFKRIINDNINILQNERCKHEKNNTNN